MIRFENVEIRYDDNSRILTNINFELTSGSFHFLTGVSGAGKTSLLRLIFLTKRPSKGRVFLFDRDVYALSYSAWPNFRRRIGLIAQDLLLLDHLTVFENVALPLRITGQKKEKYHRDIVELLHWVGLGERLEEYPLTLSGGEKQRVAIARAIVARPHIIIADEPTGNVDRHIGRRLMRLFVELNKQGTTILIATHDEALWEEFKFPRIHLEQGTVSVGEKI